MNTTLIIIIVAVVILGLIIMSMYNGFIRKKNEVENGFGSMDVQLKKRYDLIKKQISTMKQYMTQEKELLTKVTELRLQALSDKVSNEQKVDLDNQITGAMKGIMVAVEGYPDLKANENFMNLQRSMNEVESQISAARRVYNASITDFNNGVQMFPSSIVAGMMKLSTKKVFKIPEVQGENVKVRDLFN